MCGEVGDYSIIELSVMTAEIVDETLNDEHKSERKAMSETHETEPESLNDKHLFERESLIVETNDC